MRRDDGRAMFETVTGMQPPEPSSPFLEMTVDFVFGEIWTRPGLTRKERRWIALTAAAANGQAEITQVHVRSALASGDISAEELREFVLHFATYQGWPKGAILSGLVEEAIAAAAS